MLIKLIECLLSGAFWEIAAAGTAYMDKEGYEKIGTAEGAVE